MADLFIFQTEAISKYFTNAKTESKEIKSTQTDKIA